MLPLLEFPPPYETVNPHLMVYALVIGATCTALRRIGLSLAMCFSDRSVELTYDVYLKCRRLPRTSDQIDHLSSRNQNFCETGLAMGVITTKTRITYDLPGMAYASLWLAEEICTTSTRSAAKLPLSNNRSASTSAPEGLSEVKSSCL